MKYLPKGYRISASGSNGTYTYYVTDVNGKPVAEEHSLFWAIEEAWKHYGNAE